jgi:hypothetical protein
VEGVGCNRLDPDGVRDPEAGFVAARKPDGRLRAVELFYSMHPTVLHEDSKLVSSDFPGFARAHIEEQFPGAKLVYHTGPCGNLSTRYHVRGQTFAEAERLGTRLGEQVCESLRTAQNWKQDLTLAGRRDYAELPPREFPSVDEAEKDLQTAREKFDRLKREGAEHGKVRTAECAVFGAEEQLTLAEAQASGELDRVHKRYEQAEMQVLRIGDAFIVGLPGECFVEYALQIKEQAPGPALVVSLANGELQGYITTPGATGYEASLSMFKPEAGANLVETAAQSMAALEDAE